MTDVAEPTAASSPPSQGGARMDIDRGVLRRPASAMDVDSGVRRRPEDADDDIPFTPFGTRVARKALRDAFKCLEVRDAEDKVVRFQNTAAVFVYLGAVRNRNARPTPPGILQRGRTNYDPWPAFYALKDAHARGEQLGLSSDSFSEEDDMEEDTAAASASGAPESSAAQRSRSA